MMGQPLPPGQRERADFPRFGMIHFARRFPRETGHVQLQIAGDVQAPATVTGELQALPRVEQTSDFHCVTTWTKRSLRWGGFLFSDFFNRIVIPRAQPEPASTFVIFRCQGNSKAARAKVDSI